MEENVSNVSEKLEEKQENMRLLQCKFKNLKK